MKKIFTLVMVFVLAQSMSNAQEFIQKVNYRGAFAPAPSPMWTSGWTEYNPQTKAYGTTNVNVDGITVGTVVGSDVHITTNTTFTSNNIYLLKGAVYVDSLVTLTIEPGTVIRGDNIVANSSLIIRRGAKLLAEGTPCNPIVFTSNKAAGSRLPGDWGGIILLGRGSVNQTGGVSNIEGLTIANQTQFGGGSTPNDTDTSGILKYVRIEYGGYVFAANKEINGLTMGAVGSGTVIDYVQCSFINDDSFEWFGGKVNCSHLIAYKGTDDDFDTDFGYSGNVQFALSLRDPQLFDPTYAAASGASTSEGFESDNDANSSTLTPKTKAIFSNVTIIGPYRGSLTNAVGAGGTGAGFKRAARIRRNSELKIFNSILMDFGTGLHIDGVTTEANATNGLLKFKNNILSGYFSSKGQVGEVNSGSTFDIKTFIKNNNNDTVPLTAGILINPYALDDNNSDFRPGTLASRGADFTDPAFSGLVLSSYINKVNYRGAFAPAPSPMWTSGWTEYNPQTKAYGTTNVNVDGITVGTVVGSDVHITTNTTFTSNNIYLLKGAVYVDSLVTLTIEPGTVIRGDNIVANSSLIIRRGAKLLAEGTPCNPIVFTSNKAAGSRLPGDWGGIILLGRGSVNQTGGVSNIEGLTIANQTQFGGGSTPNDTDTSGILKYVRIEYGGYVFAANKEINGLTMGAVGSGTVIDYVQCSFINDDSFEWFGGKVNCSHLIAYKGTDDDFDTDFGYSGNVQFALSLRDPQLFDPTYAAASGASTSEGFESDNDANSSTLTPKTKAIFSNVTIIGPYRGSLTNAVGAGGTGAGFKRAARIRRNSELKIFNSILMDFGTGLHIDGVTTEANATNGLLKFKNNILSGYFSSKGQVGEVNSGSTFDIKTFIKNNNNDTVPLTAGILINPYALDDNNSDFRPGTLASKGASFTDATLLPVTISSFYGFNVKEDNQLYWNTSAENNNNGFYVQRSFDGISFLDIKFVASKANGGNSSSAISYDFTDIKAFAGKSFYRIKQVDKDGKTAISSIIEINKASKNVLLTVSLYPNPVKDQLNLVIGSVIPQTVVLVVTDIFGRQVSQKVQKLSLGNNYVALDVNQLSRGSYVINFISENGSSVIQKFVKQ